MTFTLTKLDSCPLIIIINHQIFGRLSIDAKLIPFIGLAHESQITIVTPPLSHISVTVRGTRKLKQEGIKVTPRICSYRNLTKGPTFLRPNADIRVTTVSYRGSFPLQI